MPIPSNEDAMLPVLRTLADGSLQHRRTLADRVADEFGLTADERSLLLPSRKSPVIRSRTGWALTFLKQAGLDSAPRRGWYQIAPAGRSALDASPDRIDNAFLERCEAFKEFRELLIDLLVPMGYGGNRAEAARAIGRTGDGGVDGVIDEDCLGLDSIYVQAKRWDFTVGRPEIQKLAGALWGQRAPKDIFITTSGFSREAEEYAQRIGTVSS